MARPWERDDDFIMYLNSGDKNTHPLEPGVTTVRSAFRQQLAVPLTLSSDWQVALYALYYFHSYGNVVLKSPEEYHCRLVSHGGARLVQLSRHKHFTHVRQVVQDLIAQLGIYVLPMLSGGAHHYGQMHMQTPPSDNPGNFRRNPKLDYFRRDVLDAWLAAGHHFPQFYREVAQYLNFATATLLGSAQLRYTWSFYQSSTEPSLYSIQVWGQASYDIGESLALIMGFLEVDPANPTRTRIAPHNRVTVRTGSSDSEWKVTRLNRLHEGIEQQDYLVGGVRLILDTRLSDHPSTYDQTFSFDMGAWLQHPSPVTPWAATSGAMSVIPLARDRWMILAEVSVDVYFDQGLDKIMGRRRLLASDHVVLDADFMNKALSDELKTLSDTDPSKCFVELDLADLSMSGNRPRQTLAVLPLSSQNYGRTCQYHPQHVDFRPLAAPTRELKEVRVHLRDSNDVGVPFYTGLVGLLLYFHKGPSLPTSMRFQGGRRVTLESNGQLDIFPDNTQSRFKVRLPEMWELDESWEVALFQLLIPHTWHNVFAGEVHFDVNYGQSTPRAHLTLPAGAYMTVQDAVEGLVEAIRENAPETGGSQVDLSGLSVVLDAEGFYRWTFPSAEFSIYLPAWLARVLGYLDFDSWKVPFFYRPDRLHPVVEITRTDDQGKATEVEIARGHSMSLPNHAGIWSGVSKHSFQNMYVHCNICEPVYVGSQMAKVILTHAVNTEKQSVEDVSIPHPIFLRLSQYHFRDIEIDIRDNLGRAIPFQSGVVTATLYFRQRRIP